MPAGFHAGCPAIARGEEQAKGERGGFATLFGGEVQAAHRGQAWGGGQIGDDKRDRAGAQSLFCGPEQVIGAFDVGKEEARRVGKGDHAIGVQGLALPVRGDPEHRALHLPGQPHGKAAPGGAAGLMHPAKRQREIRVQIYPRSFGRAGLG